MARRRMLAIGLVGTGIYTSVLGAGAVAQAPAPTVTAEPSPEPVPADAAPVESPAVDTAPVEGSPQDEAPSAPPSDPPAPEPAAGSETGPPAAPAEPAETAETARPAEPAAPAEPSRPEAAAPAADSTPPGEGASGGPAPASAAEPPAADRAPARDTRRDRGRRPRRKTPVPQRAEKPKLTIRADCLVSAAGDGCTRPRPAQRRPAEPPAAAPAQQPGPAGHVISNPSFTLLGPVAPAVDAPSFFIDQFRVPPVLLPIYQAAAHRYGIRWEILAAINEIETNYGRNLSVSSAGALGWMQFMPATWETYGIDANRDGVKDPYDPVDAIFAAASYLRAAGAATNLPGAIFAYNHADWYVDSVLMRARLIAALPSRMMRTLTALASGRFPVQGAATYAGAATRRDRGRRVALRILARAGAHVVAVNDGTIVRVGRSHRRGRFVELRDAHGNTYVYARLATGKASRRDDKPPRPGTRVASGRILGRIGRAGGGRARHLRFEIRPASPGVSRLGAASIVDGWNLLRPGGRDRTLQSAALAPGDASLAQIGSMSGPELAVRVLSDARIEMYGCGRDDVRAGLIDRRVLAALEYLASSGLNPTVSSLRCGHSVLTASGNVSEHSSGSAVDIAAINGVPVLGNQGSGSITERAVRRLLTLQGTMKPHQIITLMQLRGTDNTFAMADHADHIHVGWRPQPGGAGVRGLSAP